VQRPLYPLLLLFALTLALTVCLRPSVAEEIMTLAQAWGQSMGWRHEGMGAPPGGFDPAGIPGTPHTPIPTSRPALPPPAAVRDSYPVPAPIPLNPYPATSVPQPTVADSLPPGGGPGAGCSTAQPYGSPPDIADCQGAQILARVGSEVILAGEVSAAVNEILQGNEDRIPPDQIETQRRKLTEEFLKQRIQIKLIHQDAKRTIPEENLGKIRERLSDEYDKTVIPQRIEAAGLGSRQELEAALARLGTSIERERRAFVERTLAQQWAREQIDRNVEITHDQMLRYYQEHLADYEKPARAQWQQLSVRKSSYPSEDAAYAALAALGNQVFDGVPFEEVAKARSDGPTASSGGLRDWTSKGALVSKVLDEAIFGLPIDRLSRILDDGEQLHIVRVLQREQAGVTPFFEAQVEIKQKLAAPNEKGQLEQYLGRLEKEIPVWTVFDEDGAQEELSRRPGSSIQ